MLSLLRFFVVSMTALLLPSLLTAAGWARLGPFPYGCNGGLRDAARLPNGDLVVGGLFSSCGGVAANNVARWEISTNTWHSLGSGAANGVNGLVHAVVANGSDVFVGGRFTSAGGASASRVATWDSVGGAWSPLGTGVTGFSGVEVFELATAGGVLYAGGTFTNAGSFTVKNIAQWNGLAWSPLGVSDSGTVGAVRAIKISGSTVYVGGGIAAVYNGLASTSASGVAYFTGSTWNAFGPGWTAGTVYSLELDGTDLYAGGSFNMIVGVSANNVARWNGSSWSALGTGITSGGAAAVAALKADNGVIYAGGDFSIAGGGTAANIATWNGVAWAPLLVGVANGVNSTVYAFSPDIATNDLGVVGSFTNIGGTTTQYVGIWTP